MKLLKTNIYSLSILALLGMGTLASCSSNNSEDSKEIAEDKNEEKFSGSKEDDAEYLVAAAEINLEEIKLGQLAQTKSTTPEVIALGKMMEKEHTKALEDLKSLANRKQISIPTTITEDGQDAYDKLADKSGKDFDEKYCDMMVNGHEKAIRKIENASDKSDDVDIKMWANTLLVSLRKHLDYSTDCQEKCEQRKS